MKRITYLGRRLLPSRLREETIGTLTAGEHRQIRNWLKRIRKKDAGR